MSAKIGRDVVSRPRILLCFLIGATAFSYRAFALDMVDYEDIIRVPYTTLPNFEKYRGPLFREPPSPEHMAAKQDMFEDDRTYGKSWFETPTAVAQDLASKAAALLNLQERFKSVFGRRLSSIKDIAQMIQEDVAILHEGKLEACCFMFPSGWAPERKIGMTFAALHQPVADGERLRASAHTITQLMCGEHCYHRYVWGLASSGRLSAHPRYSNEDGAIKSIEDIWFRYEHQITAPVKRGLTSLFIVDVQLVPYTRLTEGQCARIVASVNSMSPNVFEYKRMAPFMKVLASH